jgi:hypothetical protein
MNSQWIFGPSKHGRFREIEPGIGVKFYREAGEARHCMELQERAYRAEAAPAVLSDLLVDTIDGERMYGYRTGVAEIDYRWTFEEINDLRDRLASVGIRQPDIRGVRNVGWWRGRFVCVDFDTAWIDVRLTGATT